MTNTGVNSITHELEQLCIIWIGVLGCNLLAKWTGLTNIIFHIVLGCVFVNAGILNAEPSLFLATLAELAITIIMFSLGFEEDVKHFLAGIQKAWGIALIGALGPFLAGYGCTFLYYRDQKSALLSALCMTATAVSLTMVTLKNFGLGTSKAATGIMTAAILDDIGSLALVAIMIPLLTSNEGVDILSVVIIILKAALFFALVTVTSKFVFPSRLRLNWCCLPSSFVHKHGLRDLMLIDPQQSTLIVLLIGLCFGLLAHTLGFHPGIGAYMGALILKSRYFEEEAGLPALEQSRTMDSAAAHTAASAASSAPGSTLEPSSATPDVKIGEVAASTAPASPSLLIPKESQSEESQTAIESLNSEPYVSMHAGKDSFEAVIHTVDNLAMSWLGPIFFVMLGSKLVIHPRTLLLCLEEVALLYTLMVFVQFLTAAVAARYIPGGFNFVESVMIGIGMLGRAELAFVVLNVGYVEHQIISEDCFYVLLLTCFLLNITAPLLLTWWKPYYEGYKVLPLFMSEPQVGGMGQVDAARTPSLPSGTGEALQKGAEVLVNSTGHPLKGNKTQPELGELVVIQPNVLRTTRSMADLVKVV